MKPFKAFTLIEIMAALAIITLALGAIIENTTASNRNFQYLRDKSVAGWVAMNQIALIRATREWPSPSSKSGRVEMLDREWTWRLKVSGTDDANMRRLDISVYSEDDEENSLATMTGFVGKL